MKRSDPLIHRTPATIIAGLLSRYHPRCSCGIPATRDVILVSGIVVGNIPAVCDDCNPQSWVKNYTLVDTPDAELIRAAETFLAENRLNSDL